MKPLFIYSSTPSPHDPLTFYISVQSRNLYKNFIKRARNNRLSSCFYSQHGIIT